MRICPHCNGEVTGRRDKIFCTTHCLKMSWKKAHPESAINHYLKNAERIKEKTRKWGKDNAKRKQATNRAWYKANPNAGRAMFARWRESNPEQMRQCRKNWTAKNPERKAALDQRRRALIAGNTSGDLVAIVRWQKNWKARAKVLCFWCKKTGKPTGGAFHTDHITAIANGGSHSIDNLCVSCANCNNRKSARDLRTWNGFLNEPVLL